MGYSLCIVTNFCNFQKPLIFPILIVFSSRFFHTTTRLCLQKRFSRALGHFIFLTKLSILHGLQALHCGHFWPFSRFSHFSNISCFFEPFFAYNNSNVFVETFLAYFRQFYFQTQTEYFSWPIAFALWPFLAIFKMLSFFEYQLFFRAVFCIEQL